MTATTSIRLRNKLTGLYYVDGNHFSGTESEASVYELNSPSHLVVNHTFDNVEVVYIEKHEEITGPVEYAEYTKFRIVQISNGVEKLYQLIGPRPYYSAVGKQWTNPTWKLKGYRKNGKFSRTLRGLKAKIK